METRVSMAVAQQVSEAAVGGLKQGDSLTLTSGREVYPMGNGGLLEVGPIQATVTVAEQEKPTEAYTRARTLLEVLFQVEFELKCKSYESRLKELHG